MDLQEENRQALFLVQALLGAIGPNLRAASIRFEPTIELHFLLERDDPIDREELEDVEFEFLALQSRPIEVSTRIRVSDGPISVLPGRLVYARREPTD